MFGHLLAGMPNPLSNQVTYLSRKTDLDGKLTFINQAECGARQIAGGKILRNFKPVPEDLNLPDPVNQKEPQGFPVMRVAAEIEGALIEQQGVRVENIALSGPPSRRVNQFNAILIEQCPAQFFQQFFLGSIVTLTLEFR